MSVNTILITGANRGIGYALTELFSNSERWAVIACCRSPDEANDLQELAKKRTGKINIYMLDVTSSKSIANLKKDIGGKRIDVLLNNAGVFGGDKQAIHNTDYNAWIDTFQVNTIAPFKMAEGFLDNLKAADNPRIVTVSSQMGSLNRESTGHYAYRSSKAAVNKVMQVMAQELKSDGVIVTVVHPGWVQTDMGGENADITPQDSAAGLFDVITSLQKSDSGRFLQWNGDAHPW